MTGNPDAAIAAMKTKLEDVETTLLAHVPATEHEAHAREVFIDAVQQVQKFDASKLETDSDHRGIVAEAAALLRGKPAAGEENSFVNKLSIPTYHRNEGSYAANLVADKMNEDPIIPAGLAAIEQKLKDLDERDVPPPEKPKPFLTKILHPHEEPVINYPNSGRGTA